MDFFAEKLEGLRGASLAPHLVLPGVASVFSSWALPMYFSAHITHPAVTTVRDII